RRAASRAVPRRALPPSAPDPDRSLRAELRALEAVQRALADGRVEDAARELEAYGAHFPHGQLALEAQLSGVDVALARGQRELARERAAALLAQSGGIRYRERLATLFESAQGTAPGGVQSGQGRGIEASGASHERAEVLGP